MLFRLSNQFCPSNHQVLIWHDFQTANICISFMPTSTLWHFIVPCNLWGSSVFNSLTGPYSFGIFWIFRWKMGLDRYCRQWNSYGHWWILKNLSLGFSYGKYWNLRHWINEENVIMSLAHLFLISLKYF